MALAIARRACSRRFSSLFAAWPRVAVGIAGPIAEAVVGEVAQLLLDRREPFGDALRSGQCPSVSSSECGGEQVGGMADVEPGLAQVQHAAGIRPTRRSAGRSGRRRAARRPCGRGCAVASSGCSTAYAPPAPQHSPSSSVSTQRVRAARAPSAPRRARAARGGDGTDPARRPSCRSARSGERALLGDPLGEVAHPGAERLAPRRCRAGGRSPSSPRRSRRCRRRSARRRASTRSRAGRAGAPRCSRPACRCSAPQQSPPRPGRRDVGAGRAHHAHASTGACRAATRPSRSR